MFCPICQAEYRLGFTQCSDCHIPLVERLLPASDPTEPEEELEVRLDARKPVEPPHKVIFTASNVFEANLIKDLLEANGIGVCPIGFGGFGPTEVAVSEKQKGFALNLLEEYLADARESTDSITVFNNEFLAAEEDQENLDSHNFTGGSRSPALPLDPPARLDPSDNPSATSEGLICKVYEPANYGGFWRRYWANAVDGVILSGAVGFMNSISPDIGAWFALLAIPLYQIGFKSSRGTTPGYLFSGLKVVSITGAGATINQIAVRQISAFLSLMALGLGYIWIAFDPKKQAWHDKIAGTYVIRTNAQPVGTTVNSSRSPIRIGAFACLILSVTVFFGMLVYLLFVATSPSVTRGRAAIEEFHRLYNAGDYLTIYNETHATLQQGLTREDALLRLGQVSAKLGRVADIKFGCFSGKGDAIRLEYRVTFDRGEAWETYDWRFEGEQTRLQAYAVETGFQDGKPDWEMVLAPGGIRPNDTTCTKNE